jgi:hypothetical protein
MTNWTIEQRDAFTIQLASFAETIGDTVSEIRLNGYLMVLESQPFDLVQDTTRALMGEWPHKNLPTPGQFISRAATIAAQQIRDKTASGIGGTFELHCEKCNDSGWRDCWCEGYSNAAQPDPKPHLERPTRQCDRKFHLSHVTARGAVWSGHEYVIECPCREGNPNYQRMRDIERTMATPATRQARGSRG